jgi:hypothetical protein
MKEGHDAPPLSGHHDGRSIRGKVTEDGMARK